MSIRNTEELVCPQCGARSTFQCWKSINTMIDPEMKQAVRDGSAFLFTCPHCRHMAHVEYEFLYHQMEDEMMIYVVSSKAGVQNVLSLMKNEKLAELKKDFSFDSHYLSRIVITQNGLREKLAIFDSGLDDRIMEIYKLLLLVQYQKINPSAWEAQLLYFQNADGERGVDVLSENKSMGSFDFSMDMYESIRASFMPKLKDIRADEALIDRDWAVKTLQMLG